MKQLDYKVKIVGIYVILIIICIEIINLNYSNLDNKVIVINDKNEVINQMNIFIPKAKEIYKKE